MKKTEDSSCSLPSHFWSTYGSPFSTCYIPFQSSGSQESNASNRVRFGAEMRKICPSEDNCSRLVRNSHNTLKFAQHLQLVRNSHNTRTTFAQPMRGANFPLFRRLHARYFCINFHSSPCNPPMIRFLSQEGWKKLLYLYSLASIVIDIDGYTQMDIRRRMEI